MMADLPDPNPIAASLRWGEDFELTNNGSIVFCSGVEKFRQRVIRRFFTNPAMRLADGTYVPADYMFDTEYGQGAFRLVGEKTSDDRAAKFRQKLRASVMIDQGVDTSREPIIRLFQNNKGVIWASVKAFLIIEGEVEINFPLSKD